MIKEIKFLSLPGNASSFPFAEGCCQGVAIKQTICGMECTYNIACKTTAEVKTSRCHKFDPSGTGEKIWTDLKEHGQLTEHSVEEHLKSKGDVAGAVAGQINLKGGSTGDLEFTLIWDMPLVNFYNKTKTYSRYYTKYFGRAGESGPKIADYSLQNGSKWEQQIDNWQRPILEDR